ncbi:hypothetical protein LMG28614_00341 [Paraburkholderia ultramafica]|uniref:Uncharacterized protein n=1 Tax=Paraburkholderia ultramafica TaxID=1544867 RepID=A0A6S7AT55_9BURK|nr:hypothetical protein LMG28614_00341 [Paraburkholderia ultramafica]
MAQGTVASRTHSQPQRMRPTRAPDITSTRTHARNEQEIAVKKHSRLIPV